MILGDRRHVADRDPVSGVRVVMDVRPLQDPGGAPVTAAYIGSILAAFDADPLPGESFAFLLRSDLDDPTTTLGHLSVIGRRLLPPTSLLRSAAQTVDPFLLRGASLGAAWRADRGGANGAVYHVMGAGSLPIAPGLPVVSTLLDLAPWELPGFVSGPSARFGTRLRRQQLREAAAVVVGTEAVAIAARRALHLPAAHLSVIPMAARPAFVADTRPDDAQDAERLGLAGPYLVYPGRYDARQDLGTLLRALDALAMDGRPADLAAETSWPPRVLLVGATPDDRASIARVAARNGVGDALAYAPALDNDRLAALLRKARAAVLPVRSEAVGLAALESIMVGTPVVASAVGALPEIVGGAGLLVEPTDVDRLAVALRTIWLDDGVHARVSAVARERALAPDRRTWADVARETRARYAEVGIRAPG